MMDTIKTRTRIVGEKKTRGRGQGKIEKRGESSNIGVWFSTDFKLSRILATIQGHLLDILVPVFIGFIFKQSRRGLLCVRSKLLHQKRHLPLSMLMSYLQT